MVGWFVGSYLLHCSSGQSMAGNIDDIVGSGHDEDISIAIHESCISSVIEPFNFLEVGLHKSLIIIVQSQ